MLEKPHKKLDVWKKSIDLVKNIYELTKSFPQDEVYALSSQMRRAAVSVSANIAEGAARQTKKEFIQFLHMSQGSISELDTHLEIALSIGYIKHGVLNNTIILLTDTDKMLTGLIKSLKRP